MKVVSKPRDFLGDRLSSHSAKGFIEFLKFSAKVAANIVSVLAEGYVSILNPALRDVGLSTLKVRSTRRGVSISVDDGPEPVDERIAKIELARQSLTEALSAMDELKERAEENKHDLEFLTRQIERAELDKANLSGELQTMKQMAALDSETVRKVLRMPTRVSIWTERVISFLLGVIASTIASLIYEYVIKRFI